jgi:hypothetical protein
VVFSNLCESVKFVSQCQLFLAPWSRGNYSTGDWPVKSASAREVLGWLLHWAIPQGSAQRFPWIEWLPGIAFSAIITNYNE